MYICCYICICNENIFSANYYFMANFYRKKIRKNNGRLRFSLKITIKFPHARRPKCKNIINCMKQTSYTESIPNLGRLRACSICFLHLNLYFFHNNLSGKLCRSNLQKQMPIILKFDGQTVGTQQLTENLFNWLRTPIRESILTFIKLS